ncbi:MAG: calcium-binding protein [Pseudomonadota bacterium]
MDDGDLAFGTGLRDAIVYEANGRTFVYLVGGTGSGLTALEVTSNGTLSVVDEMPLSGSFTPGVEPRLTLGSIDGAPTLVLSGQAGAIARSVQIQSDGSFGTAGVLTGDPTALVQPSLVAGPDGTYLVSAASNGLQSFSVLNGSDLAPAGSLADTADTLLADVSDTVALRVAGADYVAVVSATEPGVSIVSVGAGGALTLHGDIGAADGLGLGGASAVVATEVVGRSYLIVAGSGSSSLSVVEVSEGGIAVLRDHVVDTLDTRFQAVEALATTVFLGRTFVAAGGADDGVTLFELAPGGRLIELASLSDSVSTTLADVSALAITGRGTSIEVVVASLSESGLSRFSVDVSTLGTALVAADTGESLAGGTGDDVIAGALASDALDGGAGDDIVIDGGGSDTLTGGTGADLFVLQADGQIDTITDFEPGVDALDLSDFALLYHPSQLTAVAQSWGVKLSWKSEVIDIYRAGGGSIDISAWTAADILNLDRPQFLPISQVLSGDSGANVLRGGEGADTILGDGDADTLFGEGGDDLVEAGTGNDDVSGGFGDDHLYGDAGFDTVDGGAGFDTLWGGAQADMLSGGSDDDVLYGEGGVDNIFGDGGDDVGFGGTENDRLFGGDGDDTLYGDAQEDRLFGEAGADLLFGGAGFDRLEGGSGNDTLFGGNQADNLLGNSEDDLLYGEGGFDRLFGGPGNDTLFAGDGPDALFGDANDDTLSGGSDDDRLFGGTGNDLIEGDGDNDLLYGGAGFDTLMGGAGNDTLEGNFNADTFVFADGGGADVITDFDLPNAFEKIDVSGLTAIGDFADLIANHAVQSGADAVISDGAGTTITLLGISIGDLTSDDFIF